MSYIGNEPIVSATRTVTEVTATAGQTVFNANGGYTVGYLDVFLNGSKLTTTDFTATDGSSITLTEAAQVGDIVRLEAWGTFSTSTAVLRAGDTMTGALLLPDGSASAPALSNDGDTNTGIFFPAADTIAFTEGGTEAMRIDSSGNVGIGTSSPAYLFQVGATSSTGGISIGVRTTTTNMLLGQSGGSAFGFSSGTSSLIYEQLNTLTIGTGASTPLVFGTGNTERMRIDSSGNVAITQAAGKYTIDTSGGATTVANGGTVDFPSASGMLLVNNQASGHITIWLCGSGNTGAVSSVGSTVGTFTYVAGINGYRWTNNYGASAPFGFFFVRTRNGA
jgi:hypothetical protein